MKLASSLTVLSLAAGAAGSLARPAWAGDNAARAEARAAEALGDLPNADDPTGVVDDDDPLALDQDDADADGDMTRTLEDGVDAHQAAEDYLKATSAGPESATASIPSALRVAPKTPLHGLPAAAKGQAAAKPPGPGVAALQKALNANGAKLVVDGKMGRATRVAVASFQKQHGLTPTGEASSETLSALGLSGR